MRVYAEIYFRVTGTERLTAVVVADIDSSGSASGTIPIPSQSLTFNASGSTGAIDALMYVNASASGCQVSVGSIQYGWYHDCTSLQTTLADNGLAVIKDNQNFFRAIAGSSGMTITIKGNTDIPGVLWAGEITDSGTVNEAYRNKTMVTQKPSCSVSGNVFTITFQGLSGKTFAPIACSTGKTSGGTRSYNQGINLSVNSTNGKVTATNWEGSNTSRAVGFYLTIYGYNS